MAKDVVMPALGMAQETGRVVRWLRAEGESVGEGDPLVEVETDKVTVEIEAPTSGTLWGVSAGEGEDVPVGRVIALILAPGEDPPGEPPAATAPGATPPPTAAAPAPSVQPGGEPGVPVERPEGGARPPASPKARRLARERGVDLAAVGGSGPGGSVVAADLERAGPAAAGGETFVRVGSVWRRMAERTTASWTAAPHFFLSRDVWAGPVLEQVERVRAAGTKVTVTDALVAAVAAALVEHPRVNARWDEGAGAIAQAGAVHVGLAVAVEDGLVVPVIHEADGLGIEAIAERRRDLVARARRGALKLEDVAGGTFTLSNLGMFGVDRFAAVINPPQAAILAVGRIVDRPVAVDGEVAVRPVATLTLSCDHRVVDGALGARFLGTVAELIESPSGEKG